MKEAFMVPIFTASRLAAVAVLLTLCTVAHAQKVKVEYDKKKDFSGFKTYSWVKREKYLRPMLAAVVIGAVDTQMKAKGIQQVDSNGDLVVAAYGAIDDDISIAGMPDVIYYFPPVYGYPWWGSAMYMPGSSNAIYVKKGTLVVDLADPHSKLLQWRGIATADVNAQDKERALDTIEKGVAKMFKQYPGDKKPK
jgi:hypothetical protein